MLPNFQSTLDHYARLEAIPGWRSYARARVKEMESDPSGMWCGIEQDLRVIILEREAKEVK
jgi:hypothetical protein